MNSEGLNIFNNLNGNSNSNLLTLAFYILIIFGMWRIFEKAGKEGWKSIIPIYNVYTLFKIIGKNFWKEVLPIIIIPVVGFIIALATANGGGWSALVNMLIGSLLIYIILAIYCLVLHIEVCIALGKSFGKSGGFIFGLVVLAPVFIIILGLDKSDYLGPYNKKTKQVEVIKYEE